MLPKCLSTLVAFVRLLTRMRPHMTNECAAFSKSGAALFAHKRLLAGVDICVADQFLVGRKNLVAEVAAELLRTKASGLLW